MMSFSMPLGLPSVVIRTSGKARRNASAKASSG
jgi:hypothetical protein